MKKAETWRLHSNQIAQTLQDQPYAVPLRVSGGETVYSQGSLASHLYVVLRGRVRVSMSRPDGYDFLLEIMGAGAILGEGAALDGGLNFSSAVAEEESQLLQISARDLPGTLASNPALATALLAVTATKQRVLAQRLLALTQASPKSRIAEMLLRLGATYGHQHGNEMQIDTRLSHEQIATLIGVTRVSVTRALVELTEAGVIRIEPGQFVKAAALMRTLGGL